MSASADSLCAHAQTAAKKKHDLEINPLRPFKCCVESDSSSELNETDP